MLYSVLVRNMGKLIFNKHAAPARHAGLKASLDPETPYVSLQHFALCYRVSHQCQLVES